MLFGFDRIAQRAQPFDGYFNHITGGQRANPCRGAGEQDISRMEGHYRRCKSDQLAPEIRVSEKTPPVFFAHADNDPHSAESSVHMYLALKKAKVPSELHVYVSGGHGFGLRPSEHPSSTWPARCGEWMKRHGLLEK